LPWSPQHRWSRAQGSVQKRIFVGSSLVVVMQLLMRQRFAQFIHTGCHGQVERLQMQVCPLALRLLCTQGGGFDHASVPFVRRGIAGGGRLSLLRYLALAREAGHTRRNRTGVGSCVIASCKAVFQEAPNRATEALKLWWNIFCRCRRSRLLHWTGTDALFSDSL